MIDESTFKPCDDPKIRAQVLAYAAESQRRADAVYPPGLRDERGMWRIGSLSFWKSEACRHHRSPAPFPSFIRGGLDDTLFPDVRFEAEPFVTQDGQPATAIILRSDKDPEGTFGSFSLDSDEARRIIAFLNAEIDEARRLATERFRAAGGDPASVAHARAPSPAESFAILDMLLGDPDKDHEEDPAHTGPAGPAAKAPDKSNP